MQPYLVADKPEPLKWRGDEESLIPCRCLSGVCILVGTIHFIVCHGKADFVLVSLIVLCFAPWLGHVFESIGKDGVKYRGIEQGEAAKPPPEATRRARLITRWAEAENERATRTPPAPGADEERILGFMLERPEIVAAVARDLLRNDPPFEVLSREAKKILATLWKYQKRYVGPNGEGRWTFIVHSGAPDYPFYTRGVVDLAGHGLIGALGNGQVALTESGLAYCNRHADALTSWPETYDNFDN